MKHIVLITKDALSREYLPVYGNKYWKGQTPNIDELAAKGTVFTNYYTVAPSSAMSYLAMFTGQYSYMSKVETFRPVDKYDGETLFDKANKLGYDTHVVWDAKWMGSTAKPYSECYGDNTVFHPIEELRQGVGSHYIHEGFLETNEELVEITMKKFEDELLTIFPSEKPVFVWIHMPHVMNGRTGYGTDMDLHDRCVGIVRKYVDDSGIYISSDHGNMNGHKGKLCYGFDVYDPAIRIPFISPRKEGLAECNKNMASVDLFDLIFSDKIPEERKFVYSDSAYYVQPQRKLAIIYGKYKYIYNNETKTEELYDTDYDPDEKFSIMEDFSYDVDRKVKTPSRELYFYPEWEKLEPIRQMLREERVRIWKKPNLKQKILNYVRKYVKKIYFFFTRKKAK